MCMRTTAEATRGHSGYAQQLQRSQPKLKPKTMPKIQEHGQYQAEGFSPIMVNAYVNAVTNADSAGAASLITS